MFILVITHPPHLNVNLITENYGYYLFRSYSFVASRLHRFQTEHRGLRGWLSRPKRAPRTAHGADVSRCGGRRGSVASSLPANSAAASAANGAPPAFHRRPGTLEMSGLFYFKTIMCENSEQYLVGNGTF